MLNKNFFFKIYISIILIFPFLLSKNCSAACIWINKTGGLAGYTLTSLALDRENNNTIYIGSRGFLFKTLDSGETWKSIFKVPGTNKAVNFIVIDPGNSSVVYIATESGIFKSEDAGASWQAMPLGAQEDNVLALLIDSGNKNTVIAGTERDIFITKNGGRNWKKASEGLSGMNIKNLTQNYINSEILFATCKNGLYKSEDGTKTWKKIFYAGSSADGESLESEDVSNEEDEPSGPPAWASVDPFNPEIVYLSAKRGIFKSADNGDSWKRLSGAGLLNFRIRNFVLPSYNRGFLFAATERGVFRFSEKENMWRELSNGLTVNETVLIALDARQDTLWAVAKNGAYRSEGDIYEIKEASLADSAKTILQNFSHEPTYQEIQRAAIEYAEVHPEKIAKWRRAAKAKALLPTLSLGIDRDKSKSLHWDSGTNPDTLVIGPDEEDIGWDIKCSWDLGDLIWNDAQTSIDVRSKLMVQLRDDILDEVTNLYFERRKLQIELLQNPPKDVNKQIEKDLRLQELTANIDAMTGGYLSREIIGTDSESVPVN